MSDVVEEIIEHKIYPMSKVDPADTRMELGCSNVRLVMFYLEDHYGKDAMEKFFFDNKMNLEYARKSSNWVSFDFYSSLLKRLVAYTGNTNAPFEAGLILAETRSFGAAETLGARLGTTKSSYRVLPILCSLWNKVSTWKILELRGNMCQLEIKSELYPQNKNNCLCIQGCLASVPILHGLPSAKVKEIQCSCEGAETCIYEITWWDMPNKMWSWVIGFIGVCAAVVINILATSPVPAFWLLLYPLSGFLIGRLFDYNKQIERVSLRSNEQASSLRESLQHIEDLNRDLQEKIEIRGKELSAANIDLKRAYDELKESQEAALRAERQAGVGVLASGMAHELNNPINAIRLSLQTGLKANVSEEKRQELLENAVMATARCKRIVGDLLSFARKDSRLVQSDLAHVLSRCVEVFEEEKPVGVKIVMSAESGLSNLLVDEEQIQQVVRNLMSNAVDAMDEVGRIDLKIYSDGIDVIVSHKDTGPGISDEIGAKIFDPFFSTKPGRASKGLGLSICADLIGRNGGRIDLVTSEGEGAEFVIRFPIQGKEQGSE